MNTTLANAAQQQMGEREIPITNEPKKSSTEKMQALIWHDARSVKVEQVPVPLITDPGDAILHITGTTICGSDL